MSSRLLPLVEISRYCRGSRLGIPTVAHDVIVDVVRVSFNAVDYDQILETSINADEVRRGAWKKVLAARMRDLEKQLVERRTQPRLDRAGMMFYDFVPHFYRGHCPPRDSHLWIEYVTPKGGLP